MRKSNYQKKLSKQIGDNLRAYRVQAGLSQTDLAKAIGVTFQQVQKYETGINRISANRLFMLCNVLKIDTRCFFLGCEMP